MRGTLLNTATVTAGGLLGVLAGQAVPQDYKSVALHGLGLVTVGIGLKMFIAGRNPIVSAVSIAIGGVIGLALGLHRGVENLAHWTQHLVGGQGGFATGMITSFVLFCIGPMTLLGCMQDAIEGKIEILGLKSTMDAIGAFFLAAATGAGVLATAVLLLVFQGALTLLARPLRSFASNAEAIAETTAAGGAILLATGLGLLELADLHTTNYLPAVFLAPAVAALAKRLERRKGMEQPA